MSKEITEYKIAKEIFKLSRDLIMSDEAQQMKNYTQHGTTSVFEHTLSVAKFSLIFAINGCTFQEYLFGCATSGFVNLITSGLSKEK